MSSPFRAQLDAAYKKKVEEKLEKVTRQTGLTVLAQVAQNTPVDTGRARANWLIDINTVDVRLVESTAYDASAGIAAVARYKMNDTIFISNNLPYIRRLNDGSSVQAPAGFVETAVQIGNLKAKEFAKQL